MHRITRQRERACSSCGAQSHKACSSCGARAPITCPSRNQPLKYILGFPSKFSLNEIGKNEQTKFVHFRSKISGILTYFRRNFRPNFRSSFVQFLFDKNRFFSSRRLFNYFKNPMYENY